MAKNLLIGLLLLVVGAGGGYFYISSGGSSVQDANVGHPKAKDEKKVEAKTEEHVHGAEFCSKHQLAEKDCPWCDDSLIEKLGHCHGHDVAEAFCSRCNPALIPGFKAENDWCAGHDLPESQCAICLAVE